MMKKLVLLLFIITTALYNVYAQNRDDNDVKNVFLSAGFNLGFPSNSPFAISYGGSAKAEVRVSQQFGISLTGDYNVYNYKSAFVNFAGLTANLHPALLPLKAGVKYFLGPGFYSEGELGTAFKANYGSGNLFVYSLGLGFEAHVNQFSDIDIGFRYEGYSESEYQLTGIRVAYRVGW